MNIRIFILSLLATLLVSNLRSQVIPELNQVSKHVAIIHKKEKDGVRLRWAPTDFSVWIVAAKQGWILERAIWEEDNYPLNMQKLNYTSLGKFPALTKKQWEEQLNINDTIVAVAAQALFGDESTKGQSGSSFAAFKLTSEQQAVRHAMAMFAADLSNEAAIGLGLYYFDKSVEVDKDYIYRIRLENNKGGYGADTAYIMTSFTGEADMIPDVASVQTDGAHASILIHWPKELNMSMFTAFHVERSTDGKKFTRLTERPITNAEGEDQGEFYSHTDTSVVIGKKYFYRVIGITPFAQLSPGEVIIEGTALDLQAPLPPREVGVTQKENTFILNWSIENEFIADDCIGWKVKRSNVASGPYEVIHDGVLPLKQRSYTDNTPVPIIGNYYRVYAVDTAGNENPSIIRAAIWEDETPPAAPTNVKASVDSTGIVTIQWDDNKELDLQGYRVFVRDDKKKDWYQLTDSPVFQNSYIDSIDVMTLSKSLEYSVAALDFHYNVSEFAKPFVLELPDFIAPVAPRWADWNISETEIHLKWYPSASTDVKTQKLLLLNQQNEWTQIQEFGPNVKSHTEKAISGKTVNYALIAVDHAGNVSDTLFLENIKIDFKEKIAGVSNVKVKELKKEEALELSWEYPQNVIADFIIYRKDLKSDELELVGRFDPTTRKLIDKGPTSFGNGFSYHIQAIGVNGSQSDWSNPIQISFKK